MTLARLRSCEHPITVRVPMKTRRIGLYEVAVGSHDRIWYWAVFLNDQELRSGERSTERAAQKAAEAAVNRLSQA